MIERSRRAARLPARSNPMSCAEDCQKTPADPKRAPTAGGFRSVLPPLREAWPSRRLGRNRRRIVQQWGGEGPAIREPESTMGVLSRIGCTLLLISILPLDVRGQGRPAVAAGGRAPVALTIGGEVARPLRLTAEDLAELPRQTVRARGPRQQGIGVRRRAARRDLGVPIATEKKTTNLARGPSSTMFCLLETRLRGLDS
jgi:hypothetical protein